MFYFHPFVLPSSLSPFPLHSIVADSIILCYSCHPRGNVVVLNAPGGSYAKKWHEKDGKKEEGKTKEESSQTELKI